MAKLELKIAEATETKGERRFVLEYTRKRRGSRQGVQRPTFVFPASKPLEECYAEMRSAVLEQERLNRPAPAPKALSKLVGKKI